MTSAKYLLCCFRSISQMVTNPTHLSCVVLRFDAGDSFIIPDSSDKGQSTPSQEKDEVGNPGTGTTSGAQMEEVDWSRDATPRARVRMRVADR